MFRSRFLRLRFFAVFALALVLAAVAYGFAASNTVPATNAGDGSAAIVPTGAAIEKTSSEICRPIRTRRRRKKRRVAADDPNIDMTPQPESADPSSNPERIR